MEEFEKDVEAAFRQMKREQLKAMLQQTERELTEESKTVVKPTFRWWQYAAAACVIVGIGFTFYSLRVTEEEVPLPNLSATVSDKEESPIETLPQTKPTEKPIAPQSFTFDIKESQSLGYGEGKAKQLKVEFVQDKSLGKGIVSYQLSKGMLMLKANQLPKIQSVVGYNDTLYLHFSNQFFKLTDNQYLKRLKPESDPVVIQELEKIDFE